MNDDYDELKSFEYENGFILTSKIYRLGNILSHYELYKKIIDLPGDVIELGVFKGNSLIQFSTFRGILETEYSRKIIGFDMFGEFPQATLVEDKEFREKWVKDTNNKYLTEKDIYKALDFKGINNVELIKGDINQTLPSYLESHPEQKIALLHIDTDIYEPAKIGLELLYDRVVRGGVIIFDDYGTVTGETKAVDEFIMDKDYVVHKLNPAHVKPSYIIKK